MFVWNIPEEFVVYDLVNIMGKSLCEDKLKYFLHSVTFHSFVVIRRWVHGGQFISTAHLKHQVTYRRVESRRLKIIQSPDF